MKIRRTKHLLNRKIAIVVAVLLLAVFGLGLILFNHYRANTQRVSTESGSSPYFQREQTPTETSDNEQHSPDPTPDSVASPEHSHATTSGDVITTSPPSLKVRIDEASVKGDILSVKAVSTQRDKAECFFEIIKDTERLSTKVTKLVDYACENPRIEISTFRSGDISISVKIISGSDVASATRSIAL